MTKLLGLVLVLVIVFRTIRLGGQAWSSGTKFAGFMIMMLALALLALPAWLWMRPLQ